MPDLVIRHDAHCVCTLTLNRPDKHNALDTGMFMQLDAHLTQLEIEAETIGVVVIRGAGKSFCAGADIAALREGVVVPSPMYKTRVIEKLAALPQPVIAAVHGHCFTGGLELALAADFILAADSATFADTHGKWGLVAGWGMTQRLPRRVGTAQAKRMMMTARLVGAAEAVQMGLADECGELEWVLAQWLSTMLANSWHTNRQSKRLIRETEGMPLSAGLAHEFFRNPGAARDMVERLAAFGKKGRLQDVTAAPPPAAPSIT